MRTIESPGVEIREVDLSFNTELPNGTTSLVVGYAKQGPTDELLNVTSTSELEQIYGLPENAAERYMYQTARQVLNANGNLLVTRMPYGSGSGDGYTTKYSALIYPYLPVNVDSPSVTYAGSLNSAVSATTQVYAFVAAESGVNITSENVNLVTLTESITASLGPSINSTVTFSTPATSLNINFTSTGSIVALSSIVGTSNALSAYKIYGAATHVLPASSTVYIGEASPESVYTFTLSANNTAASVFTATLSSNITYSDSVLGGVTPNGATHYFLGQPVHIALDQTTYFDWLQGGIDWESTVTSSVSNLTDSTDIATILANVGYGALVVVNEAKTTISDSFEGYYIAIADNTKMDKGSNYDSVANLKSFNQYSEENEWITLNANSLSFSMTGSNFENAGSVSEIVEGLPDFDFSNVGAGGYGDSIAIAMFKIRPSIYNEQERVLDKILYESYIGSFDSTRQIQSQAGGPPVNFFLEDVINKQSTNLKVFVNPYISKFSGTWYDAQNQTPTKFVRVACGSRSIMGSETTDNIGTIPAEPNNTAAVIYDSINTTFAAGMTNADSLYGVGESVPCNAQLQKAIGNLPLKLEKSLRLAENNELLRLDLVPEGGLGTIWTGMNLDMNNYPAGATSRSTTKTSELFDDSVYIDGILNAHTFDADSDGLLNQDNGSASEASDLYETVANIFTQFCQYTRKDCLHIADPLRYIFVQGPGDVKVLDNKTLNFSQHIFWPLKNLFGGLNTSYGCTYANWFKINDNNSDRMVWAPSSGYAANLMIKTDTNFFPWYAPAGLTRGVLNGVVDIGINPTQKQRDLLYKNGINPTVYWPGDGYVVWGQKTLQRKPSAFDRINVRRLFLWAEKGVLAISKYFVFEQNTPFTRQRLKSAIDPVLAFAKSNEGIYDYLIVCDDRNNPPEVIDRNELVVDIYIKPVRVAEYILINFIATRTGQRFEELA